MSRPTCCETCGSPAPHLHPATQYEGEVEVCADPFHLAETPMNAPEYIQAVRRKIATKNAAEAAS